LLLQWQYVKHPNLLRLVVKVKIARFEDPEVRMEWAQKHIGSGNPNWHADREALNARQRFILDVRTALKQAKHLIFIPSCHEQFLPCLGYTAGQLKAHIEAQFRPGMMWTNWGSWHIDHIFPVSRFDINTPISEVNSLMNLRPLWAIENLSKGSRLDEELNALRGGDK
jgi:hypothetical protein